MASNFTEVKKMELSYNPVIHHHASPANPSSSHYNTPVQVARPPPLAVPQQQSSRGPSGVQASHQSKYGELLNVIEDLGREIKPTYAGSKMAQERLKKGIMHARTLVRECLAEVDKSARQ